MLQSSSSASTRTLSGLLTFVLVRQP
jgi:hypothetical protein